jgi:hypothetical protein
MMVFIGEHKTSGIMCFAAPPMMAMSADGRECPPLLGPVACRSAGHAQQPHFLCLTLDGPEPLVLSAAAGMGRSIMTVRQDRETANYWGLAAMQQLKAGLEFWRVRLFFPVFDVRYPFFSVESGYSERYSTGLSAEVMVAF